MVDLRVPFLETSIYGEVVKKYMYRKMCIDEQLNSPSPTNIN